MRLVILFIGFYCLPIYGSSQDQLIDSISKAICNCLDTSELKSQINQITISDCYSNSFKPIENSPRVEFAKAVNKTLVHKCAIFFKTIDTLRFSYFHNNTQSLFKDSLDNLNVNSSILTDTDFWEKKGILFFALNMYDSAIVNFNLVLNKKSDDFNSLYYKAASFEMVGKFNEALLNLEKINASSHPEIETIKEIVKRKRNGF